MSQKPKAAAPVRPVQAKAAVKEMATKAASARPEPAIRMEPEKPAPVVAKVVNDAPPIPAPVVPSTVAAAESYAQPVAPPSPASVAPPVSMEPIAVPTPTQPSNPAVTKGMKIMMKTPEDFVAFGQANLEAFVKSGQIWSAGMQELTKQMATSAKASFEDSVSTFKAMTIARSVKEAMDLQSTFAKATLEKAMAESNKLTDASIKLTEQTLAPITARVTVAVETFGKTH